MLKVLIAETKDFSEKAVEALQEFATVDLIDISKNDVEDALNTYDVFWCRLGFQLTENILLKAEKCKYIICAVTGLDHIDLDACKKKGITVISLRGETTFLKKVRATAELTIGLTLALFRNIPQAINATQAGHWDREPFKGIEIFEKKVGILGFGRLGKITASFYKAMGATVYVYDIKEISTDTYTKVASMDELFEVSDVVSIHVNLTSENKHLVGAAQINRMKRGSYIINTSRGQLISSPDLIEALENGQLAGAAVDVIEEEFNYTNDRLLQYAVNNHNLIITPHIGGNTYESFTKTEMFMVEKLKALL
jgi:D-3-phosphoglycerate dehydrogenase